MNAVSITRWRDIFGMSHADHQEATDGHEDHKQGEQETEVAVMLVHVFSSCKKGHASDTRMPLPCCWRLVRAAISTARERISVSSRT